MRSPNGPILTPSSVGNNSTHRRATEPVFASRRPQPPALAPVENGGEKEPTGFQDWRADEDEFEELPPYRDFGGGGGALVGAT